MRIDDADMPIPYIVVPRELPCFIIATKCELQTDAHFVLEPLRPPERSRSRDHPTSIDSWNGAPHAPSKPRPADRNRQKLIPLSATPCGRGRQSRKKIMSLRTFSHNSGNDPISVNLQPIRPPSNATASCPIAHHHQPHPTSLSPNADARFSGNPLAANLLAQLRKSRSRPARSRIKAESNVVTCVWFVLPVENMSKRNGSQLRCQADTIHDCTHSPYI